MSYKYLARISKRLHVESKNFLDRLNENAHGLGVVAAVFAVGAGFTNEKRKLDLKIAEAEKNAALKIAEAEKNAALKIAEAEKNAAVAVEQAKKETMENFLKFGYAEEFNRYQEIVGVKKGKGDESEKD